MIGGLGDHRHAVHVVGDGQAVPVHGGVARWGVGQFGPQPLALGSRISLPGTWFPHAQVRTLPPPDHVATPW